MSQRPAIPRQFTAIVGVVLLTLVLSACSSGNEQDAVETPSFWLVFSGRGVTEGSEPHLYAAGGDEWVVRRLPGAFDGIICPAWSADFEKVADLRSGLVMRADGTRRQQFDYPFTWSSTGHDFAYSDVDSRKIKVVIADGSKPRTVAKGVLPTWAPNGLIYYVQNTNVGTPAKGVDVDTRDVQTFPGDNRDNWFIYGKWSPEGRRVAYTRSFNEDGLFVAEAGAFDKPETVIDAHVTAHGWSPDGERLAVVAAAPGDTGFITWELSIVPISEGTPERVLEVDADELTWSPDGEWIVLQRAYGFTQLGDPATDVWIVHPDGTDLRRVTEGQNTGGTNTCASWVPEHVVKRALSR